MVVKDLTLPEEEFCGNKAMMRPMREHVSNGFKGNLQLTLCKAN